MATISVMPTAFDKFNQEVPEERPILLRKVLTLGIREILFIYFHGIKSIAIILIYHGINSTATISLVPPELPKPY